MRVAQVTSTFVPQYFGGREVHVQRLSDALANIGIRVSILTGDLCRHPQFEALRNNVRVIRLPMYCLRPIPHVSAPYPIIPSLAKHLLRESPDIIHAHDYLYLSSLNAQVVSLLKRTPFVLTIHIVFYHGAAQQILKALVDSCYGRLSLRLASKIICVSDSFRASLLALGLPEEKLVTLRPAVDTDYYAPMEKTNTSSPYILSIGRLIQRKGFHFLIEAFGKLSHAYPDLKLVIIGQDGGYRQALDRIVEEQSLSGKVTFLESIPEYQLHSLIAAAEIFVVPSLEEILPEAMLRAMAMGKPVIASCTGGIPEAITHRRNGILVNPGDVTGLCDSIQELLESPDLGAAFGQRARQTVIEEFSMRNLALRTAKLYGQLISER